ncbi:hypothetical protein TNCV_730221 [Trichonephila clavipes]|nr:hypothetical protein TNCV_730221 [Trichonephila clavipes]
MQNRKKQSVVEEKCRDLYAWEEDEASCKTIREFRRRKNLRRGSMSTKGTGIRAMIKRFEEAGESGVLPGRGRKCITLVLVDAFCKLLKHSHRQQSLGAAARALFLDRQAILTAPSEKYSENIMHYFP